MDGDESGVEAPRPWWVLKSTGHAFYGAGGATTVAPFWRPVHLRNAASWLKMRWAIARGYDR